MSPTTAGLATPVASNPAHDEVRGGPLRVAVILGAAATVISAWGSWIPSLWGDEAASVLSAQRPLSTLFMMLTHVDAVHGTYYVFLHFWVDVFGASPFSVRLPPAIAVGFAVAGVVYLVAWLGTARLALFAGIICCVLPRVTYMGEETRTYAFGAAYAAWGTWVLVRLVSDTSRSRRWWVAYAVLMTFGTYAFLYFGLFVVVHGLALLSSSQGRLIMRRWLVTSAIVVGAASPLLVVGFLQRSQIAYLAGETTVTFTSMTVGLWFSTPTFAVVAWLLIIIGLAGALVRRRASPRRDGVSLVVLAVLWMIVPGLILVLISIPDNSFTGRYLSYSAPAVAILMAIGIETIARGGLRRMIGLTVITTAFAAPVYLSQRTPYAKNGSDWAQISAAIGARAHAGDAIVFDDGARPSRRPRLALHTYPAGFTGLDDVTIMTPYQQSTTWYDRTYTVAGAEKLGRFANIHTVWVVEYVLSGKPDSYGIADLGRIGYHRLESFRTHSSLIIELGNG